MEPIHIHTLVLPELPPNKGFLDVKLNFTIFEYPIAIDKIHPLRIDWKYRVSLSSNHLFSFIAESKFIIQDDGIPMLYLDCFNQKIVLSVPLVQRLNN